MNLRVFSYTFIQTNLDNRPYLLAAAKRAHIEVLRILMDYYEKHPHPDISQKLEYNYYYAICVRGDMNLFNEFISKIISMKTNPIADPRYAEKAAISGGQLEILKSLHNLKTSSYSRAQNLFSDLVEALKIGDVSITQYMLNEYGAQIITKDQHEKLLRTALYGGNPTVINLILKITKLKFKIEYLANVMFSGNLNVVKRFQERFPETFDDEFHKVWTQDLNSVSRSLEMTNFAVSLGVDNWDELVQSALYNSNLGVLDLVANHIGVEKTMEILEAIPKTLKVVRFEEYLKYMKQ